VFSGHFHNRSSGNNIKYIGAAYEFDWSDAGQYRGMAVLDTETGKVSSLRNPYRMFNVIEYNGQEDTPTELAGSYVRIVVGEKPSESAFDDFIAKIEDIGISDLTIIDNSTKMIELSDEILEIDDVKTVCDSVIASSDVPNRSDVQAMFDRLYKESVN
jgi:hypothetical protein